MNKEQINIPTFFEKNKWRNIFKDITDEQKFLNLKNSNKTFYVGIDPTGSDLHLGHLLSFISVKLIQDELNINPVFVVGGFTATIGDPSGKNSERKILETEIVESNLKQIKKRIIYLTEKLNIKNYQIKNNADFYEGLSIIDFYRFFGKNINLNHMLQKDMIKKRLDVGISYTEFSYQLFQAIDFYSLNRDFDCFLQIGGSDQWGNIVSGIELIRKINSINGLEQEKKIEPVGLTTNLILDANGNKIGKSEGKPLWVNPKKVSSYVFHQYFLNLDDESAKKLLSSLTLITKEDYDSILKESTINPKIKPIQNNLSKHFITLFYSKADYEKALLISYKLFNKEYDYFDENNILEIKDFILTINFDLKSNLFDNLIIKKIIKSKRELNEFLNAGAIKINNNVIKDINLDLNEFSLNKNFFFLDVGKKKKILILLK